MDTINQSITLFQKAQDAVKDQPELLDRVTREKLSLDLSILVRYRALQQQVLTEKKEFLGPKDPMVALQQYIDTAKKFGVQGYFNRKSFESQIPRLKASFAPSVPLPAFAAKFPKEDVVDVQQSLLQLYNLGKETSEVEDAAASNGKAATIIGDTVNWAIMYNLDKAVDISPVKWHVYAMVRVDTYANAPQTGLGLESGIHDSINGKSVVSMKIPVEQVAGATYQPIDLGAHQVSNGVRLWFAPTKNPAVKKLYVDRVILIRENKSAPLGQCRFPM